LLLFCMLFIWLSMRKTNHFSVWKQRFCFSSISSNFLNDEQILFSLAERKKGTVNIAERERQRELEREWEREWVRQREKESEREWEWVKKIKSQACWNIHRLEYTTYNLGSFCFCTLLIFFISVIWNVFFKFLKCFPFEIWLS